MIVEHSFKGLSIKKEVADPSIILSNKLGGYFFLGKKSRYNGLFFYENNDMYKVIHKINIDNKINILKNNFVGFETRGKINEKFFMPYGQNSFVYELNKEAVIELVLDIRKSYSSPEFGRHYSVFSEKGKTIINYYQDDGLNCYLVIDQQDFEKIERWVEEEYETDKGRNSPPYSGYVFSAIILKGKRLIFSFSSDKDKAIKENDRVINNLDRLKEKQKKEISHIYSLCSHIKDKDLKIAYLCALTSLYNLDVDIGGKEGIFAGYPWFFQFWARDEAISLKALSYIKKVDKILDRLAENPYFNYQGSDFRSIDALGWIAERSLDLGKKIDMDHSGELIYNGAKETWMDTIDRSGARIEVQALYQKDKDLIRKKFWDGSYLKDGSEDETIRPNLFIAAYICPELLSKEEWNTCFQNVLPKLWLDWGGLSTIDKTDQLFQNNHTGQDTKSYHDGDSWFYLNNMAALVMNRINKRLFSTYIKKILSASKEEILWKGAVGCHAELSSADKLSSEGCLSQAWSAAMFIELVDELNKNN
ncbi:MAG: amylo-alpha-1,6-glucosidase [Nanoarchaeota archaeon]